MVDRRLGMAEAPGSNPGQSTSIFLFYFSLVYFILFFLFLLVSNSF